MKELNRKYKLSRRICAFLCTLALIISMLPTVTFSVRAAEETEDDAANGLLLSKTATLADDGTYTINLEAYSTGEVSGGETIPTDVVMVLDVSGSMKWSMKGEDNGSGERLKALKSAAKAFVEATEEKNQSLTAGNKHRIAIVKFAGNKTNTVGNDTYKDGSNRYNYSQIVQTLTEVTSSNLNTMTGLIDNFNASGATAVDYGLQHANSIITEARSDKDYNRNQIVIVFTDGEPNHFSGFDDTVAATAVNEAYSIKSSGASIYAIGILTNNYVGASYNPQSGNGNNDVNRYMHAVSSNYPNATAKNWYGNASWNNLSFDTGGSYQNGYFSNALTEADLQAIFDNIADKVGTTEVTLDSTSVVRDILPVGFSVSGELGTGYTITAKASHYLGNGDWGTPYDPKDSSNNNLLSADATYNASTQKTNIDVTGFSFKDNYVLEEDPDNNNSPRGSKLMITITGVTVSDAAIANGFVSTNDASSGIYENKNGTLTLVEAFKQPKTLLKEKTYVLDYGKPVTLTSTDWAQKTITHLDKDGMNKISTASLAGFVEEYGSVSYNGSTTLTYTPQKINWDGYDSFYAFGKITDTDKTNATTKETVTTGDNIWSKINVIPATNVYYEDNFMIFDDVTRNSTDSGVSIQYTGNWNSTGTSQTEKQFSTNDRYGYDENNDDDVTYSNGSAHSIEGVGAGSKATFTFTGTGVDIYSTTDMTTGLVRATLYKVNKDASETRVKVLDVDQKWDENGSTLYQIPTLFFQNLEYGTYRVEIMVANGGTTEGRRMYYLDGVRVYNPLGRDSDIYDDTVSNAYDEANEGSPYVETVRNILLDAKTVNNSSITNGAVFIDYESASTDNIGTYAKFGPKNEVYLEKGQAIAFNIKMTRSDNSKVLIGMKAPNGATEATYTNGNKTTTSIPSAADAYYIVTPDEKGNVVIQNTGDNLLSITKLRVTNVAADSITAENTVQINPVLLSYVQTFPRLTETEDSTNTVDTVMLDEDDIVIEDIQTTNYASTNIEDERWSSIETSATEWLENK